MEHCLRISNNLQFITRAQRKHVFNANIKSEPSFFSNVNELASQRRLFSGEAERAEGCAVEECHKHWPPESYFSDKMNMDVGTQLQGLFWAVAKVLISVSLRLLGL